MLLNETHALYCNEDSRVENNIYFLFITRFILPRGCVDPRADLDGVKKR